MYTYICIYTCDAACHPPCRRGRARRGGGLGGQRKRPPPLSNGITITVINMTNIIKQLLIGCMNKYMKWYQ